MIHASSLRLASALYYFTWVCLIAAPALLIYVIVSESYQVDGVLNGDLLPLQKLLAAAVAA